VSVKIGNYGSIMWQYMLHIIPANRNSELERIAIVQLINA